jgi:hypothetical protein
VSLFKWRLGVSPLRSENHHQSVSQHDWQVKVKFALEDAMKVQRVMGGHRHAPDALPPEKSRYPPNRRLCGPQGRSGRGVEKVALTGIRSPDRPAHSKSLYRLRYPGPSNMTGRQRNPFGMKRYVNEHVIPDVSNDRAPFILWHYDTSKRREPPTRLESSAEPLW